MRVGHRNPVPASVIVEERAQCPAVCSDLPAGAIDQISIYVRLLARVKLRSHSGPSSGAPGLQEVLTAVLRSGAFALISQGPGSAPR
jgi:hypothetical protein